MVLSFFLFSVARTFDTQAMADTGTKLSIELDGVAGYMKSFTQLKPMRSEKSI